MKRLTSLFLALMMLLSIMPTAFATENEVEYNSLTLPLRNEVREELSEEELAMPMMFSTRPMTLSDESAENTDIPAANGGGGGGGTGSSSGGGVLPSVPSSPSGGGGASGEDGGGASAGGGGGGSSMEGSSVIDGTVIKVAIDNPCNEAVKKGYSVVISDVLSLLDEEVADIVYDLLNWWYFDGTYVVFEGNETQESIYTDKQMIRCTDVGGWELIIPVPKELENGDYDVEAHFFVDAKSATSSNAGYSEIVVSFPIVVCEIPEEEKGEDFDESELWSLNDTAAFKDENVSIAQHYDEEVVFTLENALPADRDMIGFAIDEAGNIVPLRAYCSGNEVMVEFVNRLKTGEYDCYFHIAGTAYEEDEDIAALSNTVFGPAKLKVKRLSFENSFYKFDSQEDQYIYVNIGSSAAADIPYEYSQYDCSATLEFFDKQGNLVKSVSSKQVGLEIRENFDVIADLDIFVENTDVAPGEYDVKITLFGPDNGSVVLGSAEMLVIDDPVIMDAYVLNYGKRLTPFTESFYVSIQLDEGSLNWEKYNVNMLDSRGNVVAQTVSKDLAYIDEYNGSTFLYKLEVKEPLSTDKKYFLEIQVEKPMNIYSYCDKVDISVREYSLVKYAVLLGDAVKVYTENLLAGQYKIYENRTQNILPVEIDENGEGVFVPTHIEEGYTYFYLRNEDDSSIDSFSVYKEYQYDNTEKKYIGMKPYWIPEGATDITDVSLHIEDGDYSQEDIEYVQFIREETSVDGDAERTVIAELKNITVQRMTEEGINSTDRYYELEIRGDIIVAEGKSFEAGLAYIELKFKDGTEYKGEVMVKENGTVAYDYHNTVNDRFYYGEYVDGIYVDYIISGNKLRTLLEKTNVRAAEVYIYKRNQDGNDEQVGETLKINDSLECCTKEHGLYNTYDIEIPVELEENTVYYMQIKTPEGEEICHFGDFVCSAEPMVRTSIWCNYNTPRITVLYINLGDNPEFTFKVVAEDGTEYDISAIKSDVIMNDIYYVADFDGVPSGIYKVKVYCNGEEVDNIVENAELEWVKKTKPYVDRVEYYGGELAIYGELLDVATDGYVEVYKEGKIQEAQSTKLEKIGRLELEKPFNSSYISANCDSFEDLETGEYKFVVVLDGKVAGTELLYLEGKEPDFSETIVLNGGRRYTNADDVDLDIISKGYKLMKIAFSEDELAETVYEPISRENTISIADKSGEITVYVQLASEDTSKTVTKTFALFIDRDAPEISESVIPETISMWSYAELSFASNEVLKNAYAVLHTKDGVKQYPISYEKETENGTFAYRGKVYINSFYSNNAVEKIQIIATDRAGNKTVRDFAEGFYFLAPRKISGSVSFNDVPVTNAYVYLYKVVNGIEYYAGFSYTDGNGMYNFYDINKNEYVIKVEKNQYKPAQIAVNADEFNSGDISGKDVALESKYDTSCILTVKVEDSTGAPVENADISVYSWYTDFSQGMLTNAEGKVTVSVPYSGSTYYCIYLNSDNYSDSKGVYISSQTKEITFVMPRMGTISGVALRGGQPVANEEIVISGKNSYYMTYVTTNAEGKFTAKVTLRNNKESYTVSVNNYSSKYSGSAEVDFENGATTAEVTLNLKGNIRIKGRILDSVTQQPVADYPSIDFYGDNMYITVTPDAEGNFETPDLFAEGEYTVYSYASWYSDYKTIEQTFKVTEEDMTTPIKELNLSAEKARESQFSSVGNSITATADVIAKGEKVTINVKFHNDGTQTLSNVEVYANIPAGATIEATNGVNSEDGLQTKMNVATLKPDDTGSLTFTLGTETFEGSALIVPGYVKANNKTYPIGSVSVQLVSATLTAPPIVKSGESFKVSGEALSGSNIEIQNYKTKETLAVTNLVSKWYFADIPAQTEDVTLIAKVTKDGKVGYSQPVIVKVENDPIAVKDVLISWDLGTYGKNEYFGYPTFSMWEGYSFNISVSFDNMPQNATVKYSFVDAKNIPANKSGEYYRATINNWSGYGTKKIIATVTDGEDKYEFIVAEVIILIDPSGYITDEETGAPIVGASVLLEVKNTDGSWIVWDGPLYGQQNPMITDSEGYYGWMVPEGEYRIKVSKDGYESKIVEEYVSRDYSINGEPSKITVLPMRTDVDITLKSNRQAQINSTPTVVAGGKLKFTSSRPVKPDTVTNESFKITDSNEQEVTGSITLSENNTVIIFKEDAALVSLLSGEETYTLTVSGVEDVDGNEISFVETYQKGAEAPALAAPVATFEDGNIKLAFAQGTAEIANKGDIVVKNGDTVTNGTFIWRDGAVIFVPDEALSGNTTYSIIIPETVRTINDNYLVQEATLSVTTPEVTTPPGDEGDGSEDNDGGDNGSGDNGSGDNGSGDNGDGDNGDGDNGSGDNGSGDNDDGDNNNNNNNNGSSLSGGGGGGVSVAKPVASVSAGEVEAGTKVTLSTKTKDAVIYYTVDGTEPTNKSAVYSEAIVINETVTLKAIAMKGKAKSSVLTVEYTVKKEAEKEEEKPSATAPKFADVAGYDWAKEAIVALAEKGIIKGVSDTAFAPADNIKRADFMLLLVRMLGLDAEFSENFNDVSSDMYYYEALGVAKKLGLTTGVGNNKFEPEANITRQDMFVLAYRILQMQQAELTDAEESTIAAFGDYSKIADYAKGALSTLVKNGLVKGSDNKINPEGNATRAETAVFIYRLYDLLNK